MRSAAVTEAAQELRGVIAAAEDLCVKALAIAERIVAHQQERAPHATRHEMLDSTDLCRVARKLYVGLSRAVTDTYNLIADVKGEAWLRAQDRKLDPPSGDRADEGGEA